MDKQSIAGLIIIGAILFGFTWYNSQEQAKYQDQLAQQQAKQELVAPENNNSEEAVSYDSAPVNNQQPASSGLSGELVAARQAQESFYTVENDLMVVTFSSKGGRVASVRLKDYNTYKGTPVELFDQSTSRFDLQFYLNREFGTYSINTSDYNFIPSTAAPVVVSSSDYEFSMRLMVDSVSYLEYVYTIQPDNYMVDMSVSFAGLKGLVATNQSDMIVDWSNTSYQNEKGFDNENRYTTVAYKYPNENSIEELSMSTETKNEQINTKVEWVAFKQQFFSSIMVAGDNFTNGSVGYSTFNAEDNFIKRFSSKMSLAYNESVDNYDLSFYFGPNKYSTLKKYNRRFQEIVPLGGWVIGWVNQLIVIPVFDTLEKHIANYGIIILLLTIFIKLLIAPLTYKSYLSTAKMRLLKPEMDKINEKYPNQADAMKKQQATMDLYKKSGVSPMGGCLPMLIQFPILIAMFRFFPASIELRGEPFLWADDLSSYDSILNLPFTIPFYGSHVSLFTLLMAAALYVSSKINYNQTASTAPQMAGMKFMMLYMMPAMMVVWFNNYSSGLSYYYFLSSLFTIGQTYAFRYAVSDTKLHATMQANAAKPRAPKKKSAWQQRYEDMVRQQQLQQQQKNKK
ncbi:MAG: membrane protein insertase YidC [Rikenellaceae bacterium]